MKGKQREFQRKVDEVYVDFPGHPDVMDWNVENISIGGLRLTGTLDVEPGTELECMLTFPAAGVDIHVRAVLVWRMERTYGLVFGDLEPGDRLRFAHALYLGRRLKQAA